MEERKQHIKNILKDCFVNLPGIGEDFDAWLNQKVSLIMDYVPIQDEPLKKNKLVDKDKAESSKAEAIY